MNTQSRLSYIVKSFIKPEEFPTLRGVVSKWENETIHLSFFFNGEISEEIKENASVLATEILAQFSSGNLKEEYIRLDFPRQLPNSPFLSYKRR